MTNGEKIKEIFPNRVLTSINNSYYWGDDILVSKSFWNAEYKEPNKSEIPTGSNTKDDLALIHTWGLDEEIRCIMCTNHMKSNRGCDGGCVVNKDMYNAVMDAIEKRIQPTTKNDLGVDCISRKLAIRELKESAEHHANDSREEVLLRRDRDIIKALPTVTPIRPKGHWREVDTNMYACSKCSHVLTIDPLDNSILEMNTCPFCSAKMEEVEK